MSLNYTQLKNAALYISNKCIDQPPTSEMNLIIYGAGGELPIYWHNGTQKWTALFSFEGEIPNTQSPIKWLPVSKHDLGRLTAANQIETSMFDPTSNDFETLDKHIGKMPIIEADESKSEIDPDGFRAVIDRDESKVIISRENLFIMNQDLEYWIVKQNHNAKAKANSNQKAPRRKMRDQEEAIIGALQDLKYDPKNLSKNPPGKSGVKAEVRDLLRKNPLFKGRTVFDKAWSSLRKFGLISDS